MAAVNVLVSIGTTHPWNIAGAGLDARVAAEYDVPHAMCVVAVSAQDARGLHALHCVPPDVIIAQMEALPPEIGAVRIGALASTDSLRAVLPFVQQLAARIPVVVDPVISVSLGGELAADDALENALANELLRLPVIVTPNLPEASQLLGLAVETFDDRSAAAQAFVQRGARAALLKGGHREGDTVDVLADASGVRSFTAPRLAGSMRGTGCTLAAALSCELMAGAALDDAVQRAREYVRGKIAAGRMRGGLQVAF